MTRLINSTWIEELSWFWLIEVKENKAQKFLYYFFLSNKWSIWSCFFVFVFVLLKKIYMVFLRRKKTKGCEIITNQGDTVQGRGRGCEIKQNEGKLNCTWKLLLNYSIIVVCHALWLWFFNRRKKSNLNNCKQVMYIYFLLYNHISYN